ncbi:hypothetical protein SAM23877_7419 [Streptomyces ambofaciens ATCC 23877]|uniref:Uncharacterized protein n=1 Tax=Streptomyces ambofaciens (strain ATCC 23877 / 3486 / DSM 40053 / JCM 4204 / NBRC 12836 / NRRL B-2516) TaxID=278992 RepID=A0A0K2B4Y4_STRA7|nr:hypothetical protein SAM23877_7419 [Streptomyces ambofaciens ATCC 23877]
MAIAYDERVNLGQLLSPDPTAIVNVDVGHVTCPTRDVGRLIAYTTARDMPCRVWAAGDRGGNGHRSPG